jgi:cysteinyl-tRNA synthetase
LVFDTIRRYLEYRNFQVLQVMNYTDVDDKIIRRAQIEEVDPLELAERYIDEFKRHLADLNVLPASANPRATQVIDQIIEMVQGLVQRGYAYEVDGDVYFRVSKDEDYGKLSGRRLEDMMAGARVEIDERKENPMDFALWKASKAGEPAWESPWGLGRPGWHIECSAMNLQFLGEQIDIHGGGTDLIFPHHENEIAQTESLTGKPMATFWVHNGMMQLAGEKMSKSLGNLVTVEGFLAQHSADTLRMMILNSSYRSPLTYSDETVSQAKSALNRFQSALRPALAQDGDATEEAAAALQSQVAATQEGFVESMDDDFNTAGALGHLFDLVRAINQARADGISGDVLEGSQAVFLELAQVLGLTLEREERHAAEVDPFIDLLVELRTELRRQKKWGLSDKIRDRLANLEVILEDAKEGTTWRWE